MKTPIKHLFILLLFCSTSLLMFSCKHKDKTTVVKDNWEAVDTTISKRTAFIKKIIAIPYDSVYMTNYRPGAYISHPLIKDCLKQTDINDLLMTLKNQDISSFFYSMCFNPRLFFYFIKNRDTTASVEVCFECSMIRHKIYATNETLYIKMNNKTIMEFNKYCNDYNLEFTRFGGKRRNYTHKDSLDYYIEDSLTHQEEMKYHLDKLEKLKNEHVEYVHDSLMRDSMEYSRKYWWEKIF